MKAFTRILVALCLGMTAVSVSWANTEDNTTWDLSIAVATFSEKVTETQKDVATLAREVAVIKAANKNRNNKVIKSRIRNIEKMIASIPKQGNQGPETSASLLALSQEVEILKKESKKQQNLEKRLNSLGTQQTEILNRVESLENRKLPYLEYTLFAVFGLLLVLLFLVGKSRFQKLRKDLNEAASQSGSNTSRSETAINVANRAKDKIRSVDKSIKEMESKLSEMAKFTGFREIIFPIDFESKLSILSAENKIYRFAVSFKDSPDKEIRIVVEWKSQGIVSIRGVENEIKCVETKNLKATIIDAGKTAPDGTHRLIGARVESYK